MCFNKSEVLPIHLTQAAKEGFKISKLLKYIRSFKAFEPPIRFRRAIFGARLRMGVLRISLLKNIQDRSNLVSKG